MVPVTPTPRVPRMETEPVGPPPCTCHSCRRDPRLPPIPLPPLFCPSQTPTHQFCSSSSTSRVPSSSSRTRSRAGNPPWRRQRLQRDPPISSTQPAAPLRNTVTPSAVSPRGWPGDPPGPGACPEGGRGRKGSPARPGPHPPAPQEALPPSRAHCAGEGGPTEPDPPAVLPARCRAAETPERLPTAPARAGPFRPRRDGCRVQGGCPHPARSLPNHERRGRGGCWGSPSPQPPGCSETHTQGTGKGTWGGGRVQGAPTPLSQPPHDTGAPGGLTWVASAKLSVRLSRRTRGVTCQECRGSARRCHELSPTRGPEPRGPVTRVPHPRARGLGGGGGQERGLPHCPLGEPRASPAWQHPGCRLPAEPGGDTWR